MASANSQDVEFVTRTKREIRDDIEAYEDLLNREVIEARIQTFLSEHVYFFNNIARHHVPIFSKVKLGADYEADFAFFDPSSFGVEWHLVEIERPGMILCTRSGQITADLNHAIQQARDWREWIADNRPFARKTMPLVQNPFFHVFAGRRGTLNAASREVLRYLNYENRNWLEIRTLDNFASGAGSADGLFQVQMSAYSYRQMADHQPRESFEWLSQEDTAIYKERRTARLLEERIRLDPEEVPSE